MVAVVFAFLSVFCTFPNHPSTGYSPQNTMLSGLSTLSSYLYHHTPSISQPSTLNLHRSSMGNVLVPQLCLEIGVPGYLWIKYTAPRLGYLKYFEPYCCSDAPQFSLPSAFPWFRVCLGLSWLAWGLLLCTVCTACTLTIRVTRFHFHFHSIALL